MDTNGVALVAAVAATIGVIIGLYSARQARTAAATAEATHLLVNSKMAELLDATRGQAHAEGVTAGEQAERDRHPEVIP